MKKIFTLTLLMFSVQSFAVTLPTKTSSDKIFEFNKDAGGKVFDFGNNKDFDPSKCVEYTSEEQKTSYCSSTSKRHYNGIISTECYESPTRVFCVSRDTFIESKNFWSYYFLKARSVLKMVEPTKKDRNYEITLYWRGQNNIPSVTFTVQEPEDTTYWHQGSPWYKNFYDKSQNTYSTELARKTCGYDRETQRLTPDEYTVRVCLK